MNIEHPVDIFALCADQQALSGRLPLALLTRFATEVTELDGDIGFVVSGLVNEEGHAVVRVQAQGSAPMLCQRCAEPLVHLIDVDNSLQVVRSEAELDDEEAELAAVQAGTAGLEKIVGSQSFDVLGLIEDEIILALPVVVAHEVCTQSLPMSAGEKKSAFDVLRTLKSAE